MVHVDERSAPVVRVVVGFDGSAPGRAALGVAVAEAQVGSVPLHIVVAVDEAVRYPLSLAALADAARAAAADAAGQAATGLGSDRVTTHVEVGRPAAVLLRSCRPGDLLVVGSHGHRRVARMLLGSTGSAVVTHSTCPVLVVRGETDRTGRPVLVGVDGSAPAQGALRFAARLAQRERVPLRAVMAVPEVVDALGVVSGPDEPSLQAAGALLSGCLADVRADYPGLEISELVVQAHPVEALLHHADQAQRVVVASRGHGAVRAALLGSVGRELAQRSSCPVLVVRGPSVVLQAAADREQAGAHVRIAPVAGEPLTARGGSAGPL